MSHEGWQSLAVLALAVSNIGLWAAMLFHRHHVR